NVAGGRRLRRTPGTLAIRRRTPEGCQTQEALHANLWHPSGVHDRIVNLSGGARRRDPRLHSATPVGGQTPHSPSQILSTTLLRRCGNGLSVTLPPRRTS